VDKRGGGIAFIYHKSLNISIVDTGHYNEFEVLSVRVIAANLSVVIACIYRPPGNISSNFYDQLADLFDQLLLCGKQYIVCGDLNCPGEGDQICSDLQEVLTLYNHRQLVSGPTHELGHLLDLLIVPDQFANIVSEISTVSECFTDHMLVRCKLGAPFRHPPIISYRYRRIDQMDLAAFRQDIQNSSLYQPTIYPQSVDQYADQFVSEVSRILDHHAPLHTRTKRQSAHVGCRLSDEARDAKRIARQLERSFRRTNTDQD